MKYNNDNPNTQIDSALIEKRMLTKCFGKKVVYYDEIDSTNAVAKKLGKQTDTHGSLIVAEQQTAGRGRLGRSWDSPRGDGIWMTLILKPQIHPGHASMLTLVAALAVQKGINQLTDLHSLIKWPNDIVVNGKKVCGILTEMNTTNENLDCVVIGIGINANNKNFSEELTDKATSLRLECGNVVNRVELIVQIMKNLEVYYDAFMKTNNLKELLHEYNQVLVNMDRQVRILNQGSEFEGIALGIDQTGALLVKVDEIEKGTMRHTIKTIVAGEVSVRGIYGYV